MANYILGVAPTVHLADLMSSVSFADDFISPSIGNSASLSVVATWDSSQSLTGFGSAAASTVDPNGAVIITTGGTTTSDASIQLNGEPISWSDTDDLLFGVRLKVATLANTIWFAGLAETNQNPATLVATTGTGGHIGFKGDNDANIDYTSRAVGGSAGSAESQGDTGADLTAATYVVLALRWTAADQKCRFYVDGVLKKTLVKGTDTLPADGDDFTIMIGGDSAVQAGTTITVDYVVLMMGRQ